MAQTILVVDDDPVQRRLLEAAISRSGMSAITAPGGQPALDLINGPRGEQITLMLLDLVMPDMGGLDVLAKLRPTNPDLPIIVLTAKGGIDSAVEAMRAGANDFLVKPASPERIAVSIRNQLKIGTLSGEVKQLKKKTDNRLTFDDLIAAAPEMKQVFRLGTRAAQSDIPILIEGESGAGKELIARAIQGTSARAGRPFVTVNCGAIPENLIESILFGHEKGSFTGASDIAPLAQHFIARFAAEENKLVSGLTQEAADLLGRFSWPGNVRQLENTIFRAVVLCDGALLDICDFPQIAAAMGVEATHRNAFAVQAAAPAIGSNAAPSLPAGSPFALSVTDASGQIRKFEDMEAEIIRMAISRYDGHMSEVARRLGIGRSTLYRKLKEFGLVPEGAVADEDSGDDTIRRAG